MWASAVGVSGAMPRDWEQKVPPIDLVGVDRGWALGCGTGFCAAAVAVVAAR